MKDKIKNLTLIWVGSLGIGIEVCVGRGRGEGDKITPCLKLVRIMLET